MEQNDSYLNLLALVDLENIAVVKSMATDNCKLFFVNLCKKQYAQPQLPLQIAKSYIIAQSKQ